MKAGAIRTRFRFFIEFLDLGKKQIFSLSSFYNETQNSLIIPITSSNHLCHTPFDSVTCQDLPTGTIDIFSCIVKFFD